LAALQQSAGAANARTIGSYEVEGLLGEGGIGQVYSAQDKVLGRHVAIKMLRPELSRDRNFVDRFYVEAKSLGNLNHPNITTIYALHAEGDEAFMVMELVRGYTLEALLARVGRLTLRDALAVLAQAAAGISYAHRMGVIHRDIKPANLMVTHDGVLKIMDFGIARVQGSEHLTRVGEFCGTFVYASPEQIKGEEVDVQSDLYSLAIVVYRMLAGTAPFTSDNEYKLMTAQLHEPPPPLIGQVPDLDAATEQVLMRALAKRPEDRHRSVDEFARAMGASALRGEAVDILQQLCARAFAEVDFEKTRIVTTRHPAVDQTKPSNRADWQLPPIDRLASTPASRPAAWEVPPNGADRHHPVIAPLSQVAAPLVSPVAPAGSAARPWLIGAGVLALPLLLGAGYYLFVASGNVFLQPHPLAALPSPPTETAPTETATTEPPRPSPVEPAKPELPPAPPTPVESAKPSPPAPPVETVKAEPPPTPIEAAKPPPPAPPVETVKAEPPPAPAPVESAKPPPPAPPPAETVKAEPPPAPAPVETAKAEPPPVPTAPSTTIPTPEGEPDIQGAVSGAKGLNEVEVGGRWVKLYGIVDRARGPQEAQHTEALVRYLRPSRNHVVCYRKSGDTYRCYSDGQDIARLALLDRLVQLAPNAPAEYRSLLAQQR
jgi:serine/threonine-protein kinase